MSLGLPCRRRSSDFRLAEQMLSRESDRASPFVIDIRINNAMV